MEDDEETSEIPDASCSPRSSTIIYCFLLGTHSYIDGTKDMKRMKKLLRYELPRTPLKVLRGEQDEEDIEDKYFERFVPPTTTATEDENISTDIGEVSEEGMGRYLGGNTSSIGTINQPDGILDEGAEVVHNGKVNSTGKQTGSSHEAIEMQVFEQEQLPHQSGDIDDDGPLTDDTTSYINNSLSTDDATSNVSSVGSEESLGSQHSAIAAQSNVASHEGFGNMQFNQRNNTGDQTVSTKSHEAIEMQAMAEVQHLPKADDDTITNASNEGLKKCLGRKTGSIQNTTHLHTASLDSNLPNDQANNTGDQTVSHEAAELQAMAQVLHPPNTDNSDDDATDRSTGQVNNTGYQTTGSLDEEAIEVRVLAQVHHTDNV